MPSGGDTTRAPNEWERFRAATRQVLSVSKEELAKRESAWKKRRKRSKPRGSS
jgi:hypothetical protein